VMFLRPSSPVSDSPDPIIDLFSSDILAAHWWKFNPFGRVVD
jgi:hypothetical protein